MKRWEVIGKLIAPPMVGAELGVYDGVMSEALLQAHPNLTLYAVDTWTVREPVAREGHATYKGHDFNEIRRSFFKRTRRFGERVKVLPWDTVVASLEVPDGSLDFVFIDAEHTYEAVGADIDAWLPKIKSGGFISGHDYGHERFPGVRRAVDERFTVKTGTDHVWYVRC